MRNLDSPPRLEFRFPADPKAVPQARHQAMQACTDAGLTEEDCFTLDLALGEALANAVMHGAPQAGSVEMDRHVCVNLWSFSNRLIIQVCDRGPGFDAPLPPYRMPIESWEDTHGRGLPLMETLTDAMMVCPGGLEAGGVCVYLVKKMAR